MGRVGKAVVLIFVFVALVFLTDYAATHYVSYKYVTYRVGRDIPLLNLDGYLGYVALYNGTIAQAVPLTSNDIYYDSELDGLVIIVPQSTTLEGNSWLYEINIFPNDSDPSQPYYHIFAKTQKITVQIEASEFEAFDEVQIHKNTDTDIYSEGVVLILDYNNDGHLIYTNGSVSAYELNDAERLKLTGVYSQGTPFIRIRDDPNELLTKALTPGSIIVLKIDFITKIPQEDELRNFKNTAYVLLALVGFGSMLYATGVVGKDEDMFGNRRGFRTYRERPAWTLWDWIALAGIVYYAAGILFHVGNGANIVLDDAVAVSAFLTFGVSALAFYSYVNKRELYPLGDIMWLVFGTLVGMDMYSRYVAMPEFIQTAIDALGKVWTGAQLEVYEFAALVALVELVAITLTVIYYVLIKRAGVPVNPKGLVPLRFSL